MKYGENQTENKIVKEYEKIAYSTPNLEKREELDLLKKYKKNKCQESKEKIINAYLKVVLSQSRKFGRGNNLSQVDLIHSGIVGICNSLEEFDLSLYKKITTTSGGLFSYFTYRAILMELTTYYRTFLRQVTVSDATNTKLHKINKLFKKGELNLEIEDKRKYIGTVLALKEMEVVHLINLFKPNIELDKEIVSQNSNGDSRTSEASEYKDILLKSTDDSPNDILDAKDRYNHLSDQLDQLPQDERNILMYRYGINCKQHTLAQIAKKFKISSANAGTKIYKIQDKLKRMMLRSE